MPARSRSSRTAAPAHDERPWEASFSAAENNLLEVGRRYAPVELWDKPGRTEAGLWVSPRGFACDDVTGVFTLHRLRIEHDIVREASLSFVQHCEGAPPALRGTFQYRVGDDTAPPPWMVTQPSVTDLDAPSPPAVGGPAPPPGATPSLPAPCRAPAFAAARLHSGTRAPDVLRGGAARDVLAGGSGADRLTGRRGRDCLAGQRGADRLAGGRGADRLAGGPGRDVLRGGPGRDRLLCGPGRDVAVAGASDRARGCERMLRIPA